MPITARCSCGRDLWCNDSLIGKQVKCPTCQASLIVPAASGPAVPVGEAAPQAKAKQAPAPQVKAPAPAPAAPAPEDFPDEIGLVPMEKEPELVSAEDGGDRSAYQVHDSRPSTQAAGVG